MAASSVQFSFDSQPFIKHLVCEYGMIGQEIRTQKDLISKLYGRLQIRNVPFVDIPDPFLFRWMHYLFLVEVVTQ